jgi:hypothetical protein
MAEVALYQAADFETHGVNLEQLDDALKRPRIVSKARSELYLSVNIARVVGAPQRFMGWSDAQFESNLETSDVKSLVNIIKADGRVKDFYTFRLAWVGRPNFALPIALILANFLTAGRIRRSCSGLYLLERHVY